MLPHGVVAAAANIRTEDDGSVVTLAEFLEMFPQFETVPQEYTEMILDQANHAILKARWHTLWKMGVCLYVAHFCTLYLKTKPLPGASDVTIARKGDSAGNASSKSVGGVSVSYSAPEGSSDLTGYGAWKETEFGLQLATMARTVGRGMMVVR